LAVLREYGLTRELTQEVAVGFGGFTRRYMAWNMTHRLASVVYTVLL
jgi:hypothetical protein